MDGQTIIIIANNAVGKEKTVHGASNSNCTPKWVAHTQREEAKRRRRKSRAKAKGGTPSSCRQEEAGRSVGSGGGLALQPQGHRAGKYRGSEGSGSRVSSGRRHRGPAGQPLRPGCAYRFPAPSACVRACLPSHRRHPRTPTRVARATASSRGRKEAGKRRRNSPTPLSLSLCPSVVLSSFHLTRSPQIESTSNSPIQQRGQPSTSPHPNPPRLRQRRPFSSLLPSFVPPAPDPSSRSLPHPQTQRYPITTPAFLPVVDPL